MNEHDDRHDNDATDELEARINALLDGELDDAEIAALKRAASEDQRVARALVEAWQLQREMDRLHVERAPASLRRRLRRIPRAMRPAWRHPGWLAAAAAVPLALAIALTLPPREPSEADILKARQELALAFAYVERANQRAVDTIEHRVGGSAGRAVAEPMLNSLPWIEQEKT